MNQHIKVDNVLFMLFDLMDKYANHNIWQQYTQETYTGRNYQYQFWRHVFG